MQQFDLGDLTGSTGAGCKLGDKDCCINGNNEQEQHPQKEGEQTKKIAVVASPIISPVAAPMTTAATATATTAVTPTSAAEIATTLVQYQGFGSFHSENIEDLVRLPDGKYKMPGTMPIWALTYPTDAEIGYLEAFTDVIEGQDINPINAADADQLSRAGAQQLALGLPVRRVRSLSLAKEPLEQSLQKSASSSNNNNSDTQIVFGDAVSQRHFYTDTDRWIFVNHGAFGGALRGGTLVKRRFEDLMEQQPLHFVDRAVLPNIVYCVRRLAKFFNCRPEDLVPASNATLALNAAVSACIRHHTDVVAYLDLEYGSVWKMLREQWNWTRCTMHEIAIYPHLVDDDVMGDDQKLTDLLESLLPSTLDVFVVDHVTSNSAMLLPVFSHFIPMLKRRGVRYIVVDGAHGALQFPLDFGSLTEEQRPTFYAGNMHKWFSTPKSAGFMWVHPSMQARTHSPIITHGARAGMLSEFAWEGTKEYGAFLAIPAVLDFWERRCGVERVRDYCTGLLRDADHLLCSAFGVRSVPRGAPFMRLVPLPTFFHRKIFSAKFIQDTLHNVYRVEVPIKDLEGALYMRVSAFIYNQRADFVKLRDVVLSMRASFRRIFSSLVQKRKMEQAQQRQQPQAQRTSSTTDAAASGDSDQQDEDEEPIVLLQALSDLLTAASDPAQMLSPPAHKPTQEQLHDASPLPFIGKVIEAFEMLERFQAEAKAEDEERNKKKAAEGEGSGGGEEGRGANAVAENNTTSTTGTNNNNGKKEGAGSDGDETTAAKTNPMLKSGGNCGEHKQQQQQQPQPQQAAGRNITERGVNTPLVPPQKNSTSTSAAAAASSGIPINAHHDNGFGRALFSDASNNGVSTNESEGNKQTNNNTPLRTDSRAAQLVKALVAKKPCPDSTSKGGCGVYGINTMTTTAFTDSSSDDD